MPSIQDGRQAVDQGNLQQARLIFEAILQETPRNANAWLGLAEVLTDNEDKRICYENVLKIDKTNQRAKEGLRSLEPQANPLIAALQEKAAERTGEETTQVGDTNASMIGATETPIISATTDTGQSGPPTYALVALGLTLSVVIFAAGGGMVFVVLTTITGQ